MSKKNLYLIIQEVGFKETTGYDVYMERPTFSFNGGYIGRFKYENEALTCATGVASIIELVRSDIKVVTKRKQRIDVRIK